ncbi:hypothetical protein KAH55_01585, partial [bacterium]|nr:hypothetical protein [bacterium]
PDTTLDLSEQFVLSCSDGGCDGWQVTSALNFIATYGIPSENCMPYQHDDTYPCDNACSGWEDHAFTIPGWGYVSMEYHNIDNLKAALLRHPVSASYTVYADFYAYNGGVYEHVWGAEEGGHAILIVGWNDEEQSWICKNSWGPYWGDKGYFRIKWGNSGIGRYCPFIWDAAASENSLFISSVNQTLDIPRGQDITARIDITNNGTEPLQYSAVPIELPIAFHPDSFEAFDNSSWWCGIPALNGYGNHWLQYLDTPVLDLSATSSSVVSFQAKWDVEGIDGAQAPYDSWDGCNVWISIDGGKNFEPLEVTSPAYNSRDSWAFGHPEQGWDMGLGIPAWGGDSDGWQSIFIPIDSYRSPELVVRFALASDMAYSSIDAVDMNGFFVDEVKITDGTTTLFAEHGDADSPMTATGFGEKRADWLTLSNPNAMLSAGQSTTITAAISTKNLIPGKYAGQIQFFTNE